MDIQPSNLPSDASDTLTPNAPISRSLLRLPSEVPTPEECASGNLIWSNLGQQYRHAHCCCTPPQRSLLRITQEKIKPSAGSSFTDYWAKQSCWNNYDSLASIITRSSYARQEDFIRCGYSSFKCHDRLLCPLCCHNLLARPVLEEFGDAFGGDNDVFYIVISLSPNPDETNRLIVKDVSDDEFQNLKVRGTNEAFGGQDYGVEFHTGDDLRDCRILWSFFKDAVREFTGSKSGCWFSGAVGGPELAVRFQPLRVLPHANYLVWSPGFSADGARELRRFVRKKMLNCRPLQTKLFPSVACYRLRTADDLRRVVKYIFKPIDLAAAYISAAERSNHTPAGLAHLNLETNEFLKNVLDVSWCLRRVSRYGRCNANHRDYFGHVTEYRRALRERDAERRADGGRAPVTGANDSTDIDRWERHYFEQLDHPSLPRHSRFSYWKSRNELRPPHPNGRMAA